MLRSRALPAAVLVCACLTGFAGCTSYRPEPLDAVAHRSQWSERTPWPPEAPPSTSAPDLGNDEDVARTLTLPEAEVVALVFNPDLRIARLRVDAARSVAEREGRLDDPEISFDALRILESVSNPWVLASGISLTLPLSGRLQAEARRARAEVDTELYRVAEAEWDVRRRVRRAWFEWSASTERADAIRDAAAAITPLVDTAARLADAGEASRLDATLLAIERAHLERALQRARADALEQEHELRSLLGLSPDAPFPLVPSLDDAIELDARSSSLDRNPTLATLRAEYRVAEIRLEREICATRPDLNLGPSYESDEGQPRLGLFGSLPIPVFDGNRREVAEARAGRDLARAASETTAERLWGRHAALYDRLDAITSERRALEASLVRPLDEHVTEARRLLEIGEVEVPVVLAIVLRSHEVHLDRIDRRRDEANIRAELAALEGPRVPDPSAPSPAPSEETR